jgi:hypothetical protein
MTNWMRSSRSHAVPSKSKAQHNLMAMVANDPAKAKQMGIPQSVGQEFVKADTGKKFGSGGEGRPDRQKVNIAKTNHGASALFKEGGRVMAKNQAITTAKMGKVTAGGKRPHGEHTVQQKGHTKAKQPKMAGSKPLGMKKGGKC